MSESSKVLVVYDQVLMAESLARAISERLGHDVKPVETALEALRVVRTLKPDAVLLDLYLRESQQEAFGRYSVGIELLERLRRDAPSVPVLMMSFAKTPFAIWDTVKRRGAAGFVSADDRLDKICQALDAVLRTGGFLTQQDQRSIAQIEALRLTPTREETIRLLGSMAQPQQIAEHLGVRITRVYERLADLYVLFGVTGYGALHTRARELGFFPLHS
jgi:DNA-binding NarL/FixJ family response regulator